MKLISTLFKLSMFAFLCIPVANEVIANSNRSVSAQSEYENIDGGIYGNLQETDEYLWAGQKSPLPAFFSMHY